VPFDLKGRTIELSLISKTEKGFRSTNLIENGVRTHLRIGPPALTRSDILGTRCHGHDRKQRRHRRHQCP
jgi:hypothetical protein